MSNQYASEYPAGTDLDPAYKRFFEAFYALSDTRAEPAERYADSFTDDATLIMASKTAHGRDEIITLRNGMWDKVSSRSHAPLKVFPFGSSGAGASEAEVMLYGTVAYTLKDGGQRAGIDWAARAILVKDGGGGEGADEGRVRMRFYQVYMDTGAMQAPAK